MPRVAFLFLANHAEVRDGLLHVLGGGWNRHHRRVQADGTPVTAHFSIVVGIAFDVNVNEPNQAHLRLRIESDTGETIIGVEGQMEVGEETAPLTRLGIAALTAEVRWQHAGTYHLVAGLDPNQPESRFTFRVEDQQSAPA